MKKRHTDKNDEKGGKDEKRMGLRTSKDVEGRACAEAGSVLYRATCLRERRVHATNSWQAVLWPSDGPNKDGEVLSEEGSGRFGN